MSRLPYNGEANWRHALTDFLLDGHNPDGSVRNQLPVSNVRDFGARGDGEQPQAEIDGAIQAAVEAGMHVYFPPGTYTFSAWTFDRPGQRFTFAPDAVLIPATTQSQLVFCGNDQIVDALRVTVPRAIPDQQGNATDEYKWVDGLVHFRGANLAIRNLQIEAHAFVARLVKINRAFNCQFEQIRILAVNTVQGVHVDSTVKLVFVGGEIKGNNSPAKVRNSVGLYLGADPTAEPKDYGNTSVFEVRAFGLTVHHWETGVKLAGQTHDDPTFMGCNFEYNTMYGFSFSPVPETTSLPRGGAVKNLNIIGCHFEGTCQAIHVEASGTIQGALISGCVFGLYFQSPYADNISQEQILPQRVINAQGVLRGVVMSGCLAFGHALRSDAYIWQADASALDCVDLFNYWADMPNGNFATGPSNDRIVRLHASEQSGGGRSLDVKAWLRHHGTGLGFYGAKPAAQPTGYGDVGTKAPLKAPVAVDPATGVVSDPAAALTRLIQDLKKLGLIA